MNLWLVWFTVMIILSIFCDGNNDEDASRHDDADCEHGKTDEFGLVVFTWDIPNKIAIESTAEDEEEVEDMEAEILGDVCNTYSDVTVVWVDICQLIHNKTP